jgi:hypothetical protein
VGEQRIPCSVHYCAAVRPTRGSLSHEKLRAAAWLRAAGAEWPAGIMTLGPARARFAVWPLRTMRWARANDCPWGLWNSRICTRICSANRLGLLPRQQQSIQDAMLSAHAAGCLCSSRLHHIGARLVHKMSSCSSDVDSDVDSDVGGEVATDSRCNAVLFRLFFTDDVAFRRR